jgi:hypothetical protein
MMRFYAKVLVNNDIRVPVQLDGETLEAINIDSVEKAYKSFKRYNPKVDHYTVVSVSGELDLDDSLVCKTCQTAEAKAEFFVEYNKNEPEYWSLFYNTDCHNGEHIDVEKYSEEKMTTMLSKLRSFHQWDEKFFTGFQHYSKL